MNVLEFGCLGLTVPYLKEFMEIAGYPGRGLIAALIGVFLCAYGYYRADDKAKRLGCAILISLSAVAVLTVLLKYSLQFPRPTPRSGFGFPSGDSATAFSLAAAAGMAYPSAAPVFFLIATLAGISRLYFRAHYVWDVFGGALLGWACSYWSVRKLLPGRQNKGRSVLWIIGWLPCATLGIAALSFFWSLEGQIGVHKLHQSQQTILSVSTLPIEFGTASARQYLLTGWSTDRVWPGEKFRFNWVEGKHASVRLGVATPRQSRLLIRAYPYRSQGFLCQRVNVTLNGKPLTAAWLEQDWQTYQLEVPAELFHVGENRIDFDFPYSDKTNWHGLNPDHESLSVAFHWLRLTDDP
jgi:membrane-associated phospholipid phosphatase